jgi:HAD superfamily hydrolase (TIGR01509 family)
MTIKLLVFDLDGVLFEGADLHFQALNKSLEEIDPLFVITEDEHVNTYNGLPTTTKLEMLTEHKGLDKNLYKKVWDRKQELFQSYLETFTVNERLVNVLSTLKKQGYKIFCASNGIRSTVDTVLSKLGLDSFVDVSLSNEDVTHPKPNPEIYQKCFSIADVHPEEVVIIEDSYVGKMAALGSGAHVLPVRNPEDVTVERITHYISFVSKGIHTTRFNIVIPMAGAGSRFVSKGYKDPKPLIKIMGKPMIQWVVENIGILANYIFIVRKEHLESYKLDETLNRLTCGMYRVITVDKLTEGAACSVLLACEYFNNQNPFMIANSDQYLEWNPFEFLNKAKDIDGLISCFDSWGPKWSYAKLDIESRKVTEVAEKKEISHHATTGVYYYRHGSDFVKYAEQMIAKNIRTNGEFYVCPVYNEAIGDGKHVEICNVDRMWGIGTPEDLEVFLENYVTIK